MKKLLLIFILLLFPFSVFSEDVEIPLSSFDYSNDSLDNSQSQSNQYKDDPSQAVYNREQDIYVFDNYGSTESMEYLNRGDAGSYSGGGDFDRNY